MRSMAEIASLLYPTLNGDRKAAAVLQHPTLSDAEVVQQLALETPEQPPAKPKRPAGVLAGIGDKTMKAIEQDIRDMEAEQAELERGWNG